MSKVILPSSVKFLLCDDVRAEASNKLTIVGLYPDDKILVNVLAGQQVQPGYVAFLNQMSIVCLAFGGVGAFSVSASIQGPSGVALATMPLGSPTFTAGVPGIFVLQGGTFPVPNYGKYTCTLTIDSATFPFVFEIVAGPAPVSTLPTIPAVSPTAVRPARRKKRRSRSSTLTP